MPQSTSKPHTDMDASNSKPVANDPSDLDENTREVLQDQIIDPDGNVVFLVGQPSSKLQVSAKALSLASDVFKVLLAPKFAEGRELEAKGQVSIPLPDDDAEALGQLCAIIHHRGELVDVTKLGRINLLELATLVDKYDCYGAVFFWAKYCYSLNPVVLEHVRANDTKLMTVEEMSEWAFIHKVFHEEEHVSRVLKDILKVFTHRSNVEYLYRRLPQAMYDAISMKRQAIMNEACEAIGRIQENLPNATYMASGFAVLSRAFAADFAPPHCTEVGRLFLIGAMSVGLQAEFGKVKDFRNSTWMTSLSINAFHRKLERIDDSIAVLVKPLDLMYRRRESTATNLPIAQPAVFESLLTAIWTSAEGDVYDSNVDFSKLS